MKHHSFLLLAAVLVGMAACDNNKIYDMGTYGYDLDYFAAKGVGVQTAWRKCWWSLPTRDV